MKIRVGNREIGDDAPCFIIAEIGINFNGSFELAKKLIDAAVEAGCDAAKFQAFTADNMYPKNAGELEREDYSFSIYEAVKSFELPKEWVPLLKKYCDEKGIIFFSSICDEEQADFYDRVDVPLFKTTSYAITHLPLIEHIALKGKPIIMSTGGATLEEINEAYNLARKFTDKIILLHCFIKYPAPLHEINMNVVETMKKRFPGAVIGYSDHTAEPIDASVAAVFKGAKVIEKHITLDKNMEGPDHFFAVNPVELKAMVTAIRTAEKKLQQGEKVEVNQAVLGNFEKRLSPEEEYLRRFAYQTIFTSAPIKKDEIISRSNVKVLRPGELGKKLEPKEYYLLTSGAYRAVKEMPEGTLIGWEDVEKELSISEKLMQIVLIADFEEALPTLWEHDQKMQRLNFPGSFPNKELFEKNMRAENAAGDTAFFFVRERERIVGSLILRIKVNPFRRQKYGDIWDIYLEPECRGKGYGKKMLEFADEYFKRNGCSYAFAGIAAHNPASNALFEKAGYSKTRYILEKEY
ncbi:MAG: GNAT family N-acetyltransferase [Nanoarchaeota archaeon]